MISRMRVKVGGDPTNRRELGLEPLLNEHELAEITGRSVASIRRDRLLGKGCPYVKLGASVKYRPEDVRVHLERNLRGHQAEDL